MAPHGTVKSTLIILLVCLTAFGCSTTHSSNNSQATNDEQVSISAAELAQLKASASQWQQAKPGIERLLLIEQDLKLLISQLNAVVEQKATQPNTQATPVKKPKPAVEYQPTPQPLFALQVASVTERMRLSKTVEELKLKAPELFTGELIANVEPVKVNGTTYYRLKLGAYQYQKNASLECEKLKQHKINCLVSHYTAQPFK